MAQNPYMGLSRYAHDVLGINYRTQAATCLLSAYIRKHPNKFPDLKIERTEIIVADTPANKIKLEETRDFLNIPKARAVRYDREKSLSVFLRDYMSSGEAVRARAELLEPADRSEDIIDYLSFNGKLAFVPAKNEAKLINFLKKKGHKMQKKPTKQKSRVINEEEQEVPRYDTKRVIPTYSLEPINAEEISGAERTEILENFLSEQEKQAKAAKKDMGARKCAGKAIVKGTEDYYSIGRIANELHIDSLTVGRIDKKYNVLGPIEATGHVYGWHVSKVANLVAKVLEDEKTKNKTR